MNDLHHKLNAITGSMEYFLPEITIGAAILVLIVVGLFNGIKSEVLYRGLALVAAVFILVLDIIQWNRQGDAFVPLFQQMIGLDRMVMFWKLLFGFATALTIVMGYKNKVHSSRAGEYYALIFSLLLGAHLLVMAQNLLMIYLAIELLSLSGYILTTFTFNKASMEAGLKYLLFGAVASGIMLYGMSWLFALTGTLQFTEHAFIDNLMKANTLPLAIAGTMVLGGLLYKISAFPMHIWAPDVYTAAPTPIVALFSVVPKLAAIGLLMKWVLVINLFGLSPVNWSTVLAIIALLTITIGNFSALWQKNVKRMLAYSSIAHSGFIIIGLVAFSETAFQAILFYSTIYMIMNIAVFLFVDYTENHYGFHQMEDFKGFMTHRPSIALALVVLMVSLTGLPPTAGFTAKLLLFTTLWESYAGSGNHWLLYLLVFGLVNTVISLFYYLKLPYFMIFKQNINVATSKPIKYSLQNFLGFFLVVTVLILFFRPDGLMRIINNVSFAF